MVMEKCYARASEVCAFRHANSFNDELPGKRMAIMFALGAKCAISRLRNEISNTFVTYETGLSINKSLTHCGIGYSSCTPQRQWQ